MKIIVYVYKNLCIPILQSIRYVTAIFVYLFKKKKILFLFLLTVVRFQYIATLCALRF